MRGAVFFDRDGVVNASPGAGYVTCWGDFHLSPGIGGALRLCKVRGYLAVLVTSQRCVGKGLITRGQLDQIHAKMQSALAEEGGPGAGFDAIYVFTGLPGSEAWEKPKPGMIEAAAQEHDIDLGRSWLVGDHDRDIAMARNGGVPGTIRVRGDHPVTEPATHTIDSTAELAGLFERVLDDAVTG